MPEIEFGVDAGFTGSIEKIGDKREGVPIFLCDSIETSIVDTKPKRAVFLFGEKYRGTVT